MSKVIWIICKYAAPAETSSMPRHFQLASEWVKNGHVVVIFTSNASHLTDRLPVFKGGRMIEKIHGIWAVWLKVYRARSSSSFLRVLAWLQFECKVLFTPKSSFRKPDVILVSSLSIFSIVSGYILSKYYNAKFILEIRDIWPLSPIVLGGYSSYHPFIWLLSMLEKFGYRRADIIVGTMPNLIQHVSKVEPRFKTCICIPQGLTLDQYLNFENLTEEFVNTTFTKNTFKIAYTGTLNVNNPIEVLLKAVTEIAESEKIEAYILGSGMLRDALKKKYSYCNRIKFIDPIPRSQVKSFLSHVDICFDSVTTKLGEFGLSRNKWIDYMNAGKPIVCSFSGFRSIINECNCGSFVEFHNVELLVDEILYYKNMTDDQRNKIGMNGKLYLKNNHLMHLLAARYEKCF